MSDIADLRKSAVAWLRDRIEALPPAGSYGDVAATRRRAALSGLATDLSDAFDARVVENWQGARIAMLGLRASSTMGLVGACQNWIAQAQKS
mgnify:CR=1 FL=1